MTSKLVLVLIVSTAGSIGNASDRKESNGT